MGFRRAHVVLLDLIEQRPIADLQQPCRGLSVPAGFLESRGDGASFRFKPNTLHERLERVDGGSLTAISVSVAVPVPQDDHVWSRILRRGADMFEPIFRLLRPKGYFLVPHHQVAFHELLKLAQITWPRIRVAGLEHGRRKSAWDHAVVLRQMMHEMPKQQWNLILS